MQEIKSEKLPIKMWANAIEEGALTQAKQIANLEPAFHHIAIMPDCHQGYGMPIGGVLATKGVVVPNAVGVDIGCGMCAVETSLTDIKNNTLKTAVDIIKERIPLGFSHHKTKQQWEGFEQAPDLPVIKEELESARYQLGTLGGGNHFIEIQKSLNGKIWIMLHSGSRNFGLKIARYYHNKAKEACSKEKKNLPNQQLAYLDIDSPEGQNYLEAMDFALRFARASRDSMLEVVRDVFSNLCKDISFQEPINIHHNYAAQEHHFNTDVIVHRKGATSARQGQLGIIPGSQGAKSYIVRGKGNADSFESCSHGAGRVMGRKQAIRELDLKNERKNLEKQGIIHSIRKKKDLDEAASAYKNITMVMKQQQDLVDIAEELFPLAVIKG